MGSCLFEDHWQNSLDWQSKTAQFHSCLPGWRDWRLRWQAWRHGKLSFWSLSHKILHMHKYLAFCFSRSCHSLNRAYQSLQYILTSVIYFHPGGSFPHSVWCGWSVFAGRWADQTSEPCVLHAWGCASEDWPPTRRTELSWNFQHGHVPLLLPLHSQPFRNG